MPSIHGRHAFLRVGVPVDFSLVKGNAPCGEEIGNREEIKTLLVEKIDDLKGGFHTFGKNIVEKNDVPVSCMGNDMRHLPGGVSVALVLRVNGPEDNRRLRPACYPGICHAVRGTE